MIKMNKLVMLFATILISLVILSDTCQAAYVAPESENIDDAIKVQYPAIKHAKSYIVVTIGDNDYLILACKTKQADSIKQQVKHSLQQNGAVLPSAKYQVYQMYWNECGGGYLHPMTKKQKAALVGQFEDITVKHLKNGYQEKQLVKHSKILKKVVKSTWSCSAYNKLIDYLAGDDESESQSDNIFELGG